MKQKKLKIVTRKLFVYKTIKFSTNTPMDTTPTTSTNSGTGIIVY